jgi:Flp pilus assembly pilin Flp
VVCITAITTLGSNANKTFTSVGNTIGSTTGS